jgi:hypothetical protein
VNPSKEIARLRAVLARFAPDGARRPLSAQEAETFQEHLRETFHRAGGCPDGGCLTCTPDAAVRALPDKKLVEMAVEQARVDELVSAIWGHARHSFSSRASTAAAAELQRRGVAPPGGIETWGRA